MVIYRPTGEGIIRDRHTNVGACSAPRCWITAQDIDAIIAIIPELAHFSQFVISHAENDQAQEYQQEQDQRGIFQ